MNERYVRATLGLRLRMMRKARGLSQEKLGDRCDLSGKFLGEVERSEKSISIDSLSRVAEALKVPLRDLADVDGQPPDPQFEQLVAIARKVPRKGLAKVVAVVKALVA